MLPDEFGCVVANRFGDLLDDDADPFDILNGAQTDKDKKKKKKQSDVKNKHTKYGQKESQKDRRAHVEAPEPVCKVQSRTGPVTERAEKEEVKRGTKRAAYGERRPSSDTTPQEFSVPRPLYEDADVRGRGGYGGARRGGGGRGGFVRNPEAFNLRGKREYDRHNGTGISPEEKRGGRGAWNWGSVNEATSELMEVTEAALVKYEEPNLSEENLALQEEGEMVVHVAVEMSLDEWKALQEINRPKVEFNIRKAEDKIPSKAKVIHESKHLEKVLDELDEEGTFIRRSVNDITSLLDINFGSLGRPSRGGRGRGGPRGGMRGGSVQTEQMKPILEVANYLAPNPYDPDDPEDFPALSAGP